MKACPQCKMRYAETATTCLLHHVPLVALPDPRLGTVVGGRYVIEALIGEGGMAAVYRARLKLGERRVAIKVLSATLASDERLKERFRREARHAAALAHPNVVAIHEQGELDDGCLYIVMDLLTGRPLEDFVGGTPIPLTRSLPIMVQLCRAVARAHDLGIIHRDLKPDNVHIAQGPNDTDIVRVLDFGIARSSDDTRLTEAGELFGTPQYISPERIAGEDASFADDLYALGVVFYELTTGVLPFDAKDAASYFIKQLHHAPPAPRERNPAIPEALEALILQLLAKKPQDRPGDARQVEERLEQVFLAMSMPLPEDPPSTLAGAELDEGWEGPRTEAVPHTSFPEQELASWAERLERAKLDLDEAAPRTVVPESVRAHFEHASSLVDELTRQRQIGLGLEARLENLVTENHTRRLQIGRAVDALGHDGSRLREQLRQHARALEACSAQLIQAHQLAVQTERAVRSMPYDARPSLQLAEAHRNAADAIEEWRSLEVDKAELDAALASGKHQLEDLEFQVGELRTALHRHEHELALQQQELRAALDQSWADEARLESMAGRALETVESWGGSLRADQLPR